MLSPRWRKVFRDLWEDKSRTGIVVASIAVGIIAFGGLFGTRSIVEENIQARYLVFNENDIVFNIREFDENFERWVSNRDYVTDAQGLTVRTAEINIAGETEDVVITAFEDMNDVRINRIRLEEGAYPPERDEMVLERTYADAIGVPIGADVTIELSDDDTYTLHYIGTVHDLNAFPNTVDPRLKIYVTPRTLNLMGFSTTFNQLYLTVDRTAIERDGTDIQSVANDLREDFERLGVEVQGVSVNADDKFWAGDFASAIAFILFVVGSAAVLLSGFLVVNVITGLLARQRKQIGIMKMIGADSWQVAGLYLVMVATFGLLSLLIAIPLSQSLARTVASALLSPGFLNVDVTTANFPLYVIAIQIVVAVGAPVVSGLIPIIRNSMTPPIESLRENADVNVDIFDRLLSKIGGLPRPLLLATRNTFRRKVRLITTLIALVIAGGFFMGALNVRESILIESGEIDIAGSDLRINLGDYYDIDSVVRRVERVEGVTSAEGWITASVKRERPDRTQGENFIMNGVPFDSPYNAPTVQEGRWLAPPTRDNRYEIVIGSELENVEPDVGVGDTLTIVHNGNTQDWLVVGIVQTGGPTSTQAPVFSYYDSVSDFLGEPRETNVVLISTFTDSVVVGRAIESRLLAELDRMDISVTASSVVLEELENARSSFDVIIFLLVFIALLIAGVGGLGLGGTMSLNVLERIREIGVMRSIGASSNTIRGMYLLEGTMIGLMSYVLALPMSLLVTLGFTTALGAIFGGEPLAFGINPIGPVLWIGVVLIVASIASLAPAQRAAQISVREALAYE